MRVFLVGILTICFWNESISQQVKIEYDKKRNVGTIKSFQFGESQITTPKDQKQVTDNLLNQWIVNSITDVMKFNQINQIDSLADVVITYAFGVLARTDYERLGPLAQTPGTQQTGSYKFDYRQSTLVIDLNDRSGNLLYRINATNNLTSPVTERLVFAITYRGFKKFNRLHKLKKK